MHVVEDLDGITTVRALATNGVCQMTLMCPKYTVDGTFYPAESFQLHGIETITALRDLCNRMLEECDTENEETRT